MERFNHTQVTAQVNTLPLKLAVLSTALILFRPGLFPSGQLLLHRFDLRVVSTE